MGKQIEMCNCRVGSVFHRLGSKGCDFDRKVEVEFHMSPENLAKLRQRARDIANFRRNRFV